MARSRDRVETWRPPVTASRLEGQTLSGESLFVRYVNFVKLPHTVFALPFAFIGVVYASTRVSVNVVQGLLVLVAFTAARFAAMGFNRIADRHYDALNARTSSRELPSGRLSLAQASLSVAAASTLFVVVAALLNPLCARLSPIALVWILSYSYAKRFTSLAHFWLGGALAIAPVGGYLAVAGSWSDPWWTLVVLPCSVLTWVAGFDIFYALQDEDFDRAHDLKSAVVLLGRSRSVLLAKLLHGITIGTLVWFGVGAGFGGWYYLAVGIAAALLTWEHQLVRPDDLSKLNAAFFRMNGVISIVVFCGALGDRLL